MRFGPNRHTLVVPAVLAIALVMAAPVRAQERAAAAPKALTAADYAQAEKWMGYNVTPLVFRSGVRPTWLPDDRFWYRNAIAEGSEFVLVDPAKRTRRPAFDHARLAATLSAAAKANWDAFHLPFTQFEYSGDGRAISFTVTARRWTCDVQGAKCAETTAAVGARPVQPAAPRTSIESVSPDGKLAAFIRTTTSGCATSRPAPRRALTTDGVKDFGYATDNAGWTQQRPPGPRSGRPIRRRSPPSSRTSAASARCTWSTRRVGHPTLQAWKYPLPGRRGRHDDPARGHRRRRAARGAPEDAARPAPLDALRRHQVPRRRVGRRAVERRRLAARLRLDVARPQGRAAPRRRRGDRRRARRPRGEGRRPSSSRATAGSTGATCRRRTRSSGSPSATTGATSISTTCRPGKLKHADHDRRRQRHAAAARGREGAACCTSSASAARRGAIPTSGISTGSASTARTSTLLTPEDARPRRRALAVGAVLRGQLLDARRAAGGRAARRRRPAGARRSRRPTSRGCVAAGWKPPMPFTVKARDGETDLYGLMFRPTNFDPIEEVPDHQPHLSGAADRQRRRPQLLRRARRHAGARRARLHRRRRSTAWARRGGRRSSTRPTTATWATTRCPTRWPG